MLVTIPERLRALAKQRAYWRNNDRHMLQADAFFETSRTEKSSLTVDEMGALGECLVAVAFGLAPPVALKSVENWEHWWLDVSKLVSLRVRTTDRPRGRLPVQRTDSPDARYILVLLDTVRGQAQLRGWCWGDEAQRREHWHAEWTRPCYAVDQHNLRDIESLVADLRAVPGLVR